MRETYRSPWFNCKGYLACTVKYSDGSKKTVFQHREIMEKALKIKLRSNQHVHHVDEKKRNNKRSNLEVLPAGEHSRRHRPKITFITLKCIQCAVCFPRIKSQEDHNRKLGKKGPFCGKRCAGKWSQKRQAEKRLIWHKYARRKHGTNYFYDYYKCRCVRCRDAHRIAIMKWRRSKIGGKKKEH